MPFNPFDPEFKDLPEMIPIFPLSGALLLPRGELPLNIFEPRYLAMVADCLQGNRLIGIIQPNFTTGCVGRIVKFEEVIDGRYLISLRGICRFHIGQDNTSPMTPYRVAHVLWDGFQEDMVRTPALNIDKCHFKTVLKQYLESQGLSMDWDLIDEVAEEGLVTSLAMICPLDSRDKQALLEAKCAKTRAALFIKLLEMSVRLEGDGLTTSH